VTEDNALHTVDDLVAALRREAALADSEWQRIRDDQEIALKYYEGGPFGNEIENRSQVILPDVQEALDYMTISTLRTFVSGDRVVEFEAVDEEEEQGAEDATAAIGFNFMRQQDGYRVLHDWCFDGLLNRYGVTKTMMTEEERVIRDRVLISDPVELANHDGEIEGVTENPDGTLTVSIKREVKEKRFIDVAVPLYEFRYAPRTRHEDEADYLAHVSLKTRSELVEMGFDREQVYSLPGKAAPIDYQQIDGLSWNTAESTPALQHVELREEYARMDLDNDGIAERVRVFRVINEILRWAVDDESGDDSDPNGEENEAKQGKLAIETIDEQPFVVFCPYPRPHRLVGYSLADKVMDLQLARSTVARQLFDGMYNANMPRPIVGMQGANENTIDDLLNPVPGSPIRVKDASAVQPLKTTFDVGKSLSVMEWITGERESRTGITRLNQGLDADALNKTATGTALMQAQGQQQEEFIARNLAEAFSRLMAKKYRLMRREGDPFKIKVDGQYKMVDPSTWPEEMNVTIRVGLGSGRKDQRIQYRMAVIPLMAEGFQQGLVTPQHTYRMMDGLVRDMNLGMGDDYWIDPDTPEGQRAIAQRQQGQADPALVKAQNDQAKLEQQGQIESAKLDQKSQQILLENNQKREAAALQAMTDQDRQQREAELEMYRIHTEAALEQMHAAKDIEISKNRMGGRLDA